MAYGGKAPFMAATIIKSKGDDSTVSIDGDKVILKTPSGKWCITKEEVKRV